MLGAVVLGLLQAYSPDMQTVHGDYQHLATILKSCLHNLSGIVGQGELPKEDRLEDASAASFSESIDLLHEGMAQCERSIGNALNCHMIAATRLA